MIEKYFVKGEGSYPIRYLLIKPERPNHKALLYLNPLGKSAEALAGGEIEWFVKRGYTVLAPDMVGLGEMGEGNFREDAYIDNTTYDNWLVSMQIGRSIVGIQASEVIKLVYLLHQDTAITEVYGFARKHASPILLHAAAFEPLIARVALVEPYASYQSIVISRFYKPIFIPSTVPGAIGVYDLPDLAASLAPRKLMIVGTTDGNGGKTDQKDINSDINVIETAYRSKNVGQQLNIVSESAQKLDDLFIEWIK